MLELQKRTVKSEYLNIILIILQINNLYDWIIKFKDEDSISLEEIWWDWDDCTVMSKYVR